MGHPARLAARHSKDKDQSAGFVTGGNLCNFELAGCGLGTTVARAGAVYLGSLCYCSGERRPAIIDDTEELTMGNRGNRDNRRREIKKPKKAVDKGATPPKRTTPWTPASPTPNAPEREGATD